MRVTISPARIGAILAAVAAFAAFAPGARAQTMPAPAWPDEVVRYEMNVRLDTAERKIVGRERVSWRNTSSVAVPDLQFHLYQNAYKNNKSTFLSEGGRNGADYVGALDGKWGYVDVTSLRLASGEDLTGAIRFVQPDDGNVYDQTVARVELPRIIAPGETIVFDLEFVNQMAPAIDRTGYDNTFYFVAQWFPKLGVFEDAGVRGRTEPGWNCHQFHASSEFYADFGTYDVTLNLPAGYHAGATGVRRGETPNADGTVALNYYQEHVHDFAWTCDPAYVVVEETFRWRERVTDEELDRAARVAGLSRDQVSLRDVSVRLMMHAEHLSQTRRHMEAAFNAIEHYGLRFGAYPYDTLTVVDPSFGGSNVGGMEYPTLITAGTEYLIPAYETNPESVVVHEFGHQFWYGMVATNEFEESWLDEGINQYCEGSILEEAYGPNYLYNKVDGIRVPGARFFDVPLPAFPFAGVGAIPIGPLGSYIPTTNWRNSRNGYRETATADPMLRPAWRYHDADSYGVNSYSKPDVMLNALERYLGRDRFTRSLRAYQTQWRFKHPSTADFVRTMNEASGEDLTRFFDQVIYGSDVLDYGVGRASSDKPSTRLGVFDEPGGRQTLDGSDEPATYETRFDVERRGGVVVPVVAVARFEDGSEQRVEWDGADRWREVRFESATPAVSVEVDPDGTWTPLDVDLTNNGIVFEPRTDGANRLTADMLYWLQSVFHEVSYLA